MLGGITLTNIRRGVTASVGYWIGKPFVRQGYTSEALNGMLQHAYDNLGLNRVEAACMPTNRASISVLERAGFRREGLARRHLRINGVFEDHLLFARLNDDADAQVPAHEAPMRFAPGTASTSVSATGTIGKDPGLKDVGATAARVTEGSVA